MLSFPSQLLCCKESFCLLCSPARGQDRVEDMHVHLLCINDHFAVTGSLAAHQLYWFFICSSSLHFIACRHALSQLALFRVPLVSLTFFPGDYASYSVLNTSPRDKVSSQRFEERLRRTKLLSKYGLVHMSTSTSLALLVWMKRFELSLIHI